MFGEDTERGLSILTHGAWSSPLLEVVDEVMDRLDDPSVTAASDWATTLALARVLCGCVARLDGATPSSFAASIGMAGVAGVAANESSLVSQTYSNGGQGIVFS